MQQDQASEISELKPQPKKKDQVTLSKATSIALAGESQWSAGAKIIAEDTSGQSLDEARLRVLEATKEKRRKELLKKK